MREGILIPMRLGSSRLPGKGMRDVAGRSGLALLSGRLRRATRPSVIVLCTTTEPEDDALAQHAESLGLGVYRGSRNDVLARLAEAAAAFGLDAVAEVDGDDLFCDPDYVDLALSRLHDTGADFLYFQGLPLGITPHAVRTTALRRAVEEKATDDTSTGAFNFILKSGRFDVRRETVPAEHSHERARITLDYDEDLLFFSTVVSRFSGRELDFTLGELLDLLKREPDLVEINASRNEEYWVNFHSKESSAAARDTPAAST